MPKELKIPCILPFTYLELHPLGEVFSCCPHWSKIGPIGNVKTDTLPEIWNGAKVQLIRKKIYSGDLESICNRAYCPIAIENKSRTLSDWQKEEPNLKNILPYLKKQKTIIPPGPLRVEVADSGECNLRCKMCISNENFNPTDKKVSKLVFSKVLPELFPSLRFLRLSGNGEPLFRPETRELLINGGLEKYPKLKINLLTNGLLFNEKLWSQIRHNNFQDISVSIDAATPSTYLKIRKGNWKILQNNLQLISKLRRQGTFKFFQITMVVMRSNYHEMVAFAQIGKRLNCDSVIFQKITGKSIGCLEENFNLDSDQNILTEIRQILRNPIFSEKFVDIRQMSSYQTANSSDSSASKLKFMLFKPLYFFYYTLPPRLRIVRHLRKLFPKRLS